MARRPIRLYGDPVLTSRARPLEKITEETRQLVVDMFETMDAAHGAGLAGNQVGVLERVLVVDVPGPGEGAPRFREALINPEILATSGEQTDEEGCLSFPRLYFDVKRPLRVKVRALFLDGTVRELEAEGYLARALLHEVDHLDGVLYIDRISPMKRGLLRHRLADIKKRGVAGETRTDTENAEESQSHE